MRVLVLTGSPERKGTTSLLADKFCEGAKEAGNEVIRFDTAFMDINPCTGCDTCGKGENPCIYEDDITNKIHPILKDCDAIALVSPTYHFGLSAQLKMVIDRFYGVNKFLLARTKISFLLVACASKYLEALSAIIQHYKLNCSYLHWTDCGQVLATGCESREKIEQTNYPEEAYRLGLSIK
jgi:multimeric flavodoxin WrbA